MVKLIKKTSVRTKLVLLISSLIAGISVFIFLYFPLKLKDQLLDSVMIKSDQICRMIAYEATPALYFEDKEAVAEIFGSARVNEDMEYISVILEDDRVFAEYRRDPESDYQLEEDARPLIKRPYLMVSQPMVFNDEVLGQLYMAFSMTDVQEEVGLARFRIALISVSVFMFGVLIISAMSRVISAPLKKMVETVEKISAGNFKERTYIRTNDEIGFLAREFDIMVDRLVSAYKNLDELNQDLEIRIESRTAALRLSNAQLKSELKERKQIERELSAERVRLMATLSKIEEGVITTDVDNNISVMNRVAAEITGWNEIDAIGKSVVDVFKLPVSADNGENVRDIQEFIKKHSDQENSSRITIVDSESNKKQLHINIVPIHTLYGEKSGTVFIFHLIDNSHHKPADLKKYQA